MSVVSDIALAVPPGFRSCRRAFVKTGLELVDGEKGIGEFLLSFLASRVLKVLSFFLFLKGIVGLAKFVHSCLEFGDASPVVFAFLDGSVAVGDGFADEVVPLAL